MDFDRQAFDLVQALGTWALIVVVFVGMALFTAVMVSLLVAGLKGPGMVAEMLFRGVRDLFTMSPRRVWALTVLTFKESVRKKTFWIGAVFILLFMFAHWFLAGQDVETAAKRHVVFVMTAMKWMLIPVAVILSCWGLPADIKERSLHTVVTKPARRSEIVVGRILGCVGIMTVMLAAMSALGYIWILRSVPEAARPQLLARVPVYGTLTFLDRSGVEGGRGINVGDIWEFRSFIEGMTNARAVYTFDVDAADLESLDKLRLEYNFEAFRTHKGKMGENVRFSLHLVNPTRHLDVRFPSNSARIYEFAVDPEKKVIEIPRTLNAANRAAITLTGGEGKEQAPRELDLFKDVVDNGKLQIRVSCDDGGQYMGMARPDLFFRLPDRSFTQAYAKTIFGLWLMLALIVVLGTTASTFVKGPVATMLLATYLVMGALLRGYWDEYLGQYIHTGRPLGGGVLESIIRIFRQDNQTTPLDEGTLKNVVTWIDDRIIQWTGAIHNIIPDFRQFDSTPELANGFDVPLNTLVFPAVGVMLAFLIPCVVIGAYSLMMRELEAK